jgi:hypothetical protein
LEFKLPVGCDTRRLKTVVPNLAVLEIDQLYPHRELLARVAHCEFDDFVSGYAAHELAPRVGHAVWVPEVPGVQGLSTDMHIRILKNIMAPDAGIAA